MPALHGRLMIHMVHHLHGAASPTYSASRCSGRVGNVERTCPALRLRRRPSRLPFPRFGPDLERGNWASLFAPARKYEFDLARALVHERDLLLDDDIAEATQLRCQSLRFGGQR